MPAPLPKNATERKCSKCKKVKPLSSFHRSRGKVYGRISHCKECGHLISVSHYATHRKYFREYRERPGVKRRELLRWRNFVKSNPKINKARSWVRNSVKSGLLKKTPCVICREKKTEGHHDNYNKPLQVTWYCRRCHREWHKHNKPILPT